MNNCVLTEEQKKIDARLSAKRYRVRLRKEALKAYGNKCLCCGEDRFEFLSLDHPNKDGGKHRESALGKKTSGSEWLRYLKKNNFPQDVLIRVLCWNCHFAMDYQGYCPHQKDL